MNIPQITIDAIVLGTLYASALVFIGCMVVMAYTVIACRLPSGCPNPFTKDTNTNDDAPTILTDDNYK